LVSSVAADVTALVGVGIVEFAAVVEIGRRIAGCLVPGGVIREL